MVANRIVFLRFTEMLHVEVHQPGEDGVSELRVRLASLSDTGDYQCSTAQYYDYQAASTTISLKVEDTLAVIEGDTKHRYIPAGRGEGLFSVLHGLCRTRPGTGVQC